MTSNVDEYIIRQARLFHQIETFIKESPENNDSEYGYNIPMQYDIIMSIYHEVNQDLRDRDDLKLQSDLCYSRMHIHKIPTKVKKHYDKKKKQTTATGM